VLVEYNNLLISVQNNCFHKFHQGHHYQISDFECVESNNNDYNNNNNNNNNVSTAFPRRMVLLKKCLAMPKLLYTLRTSDCSNNPLLAQFDNTLKAALSAILNVDLSDDQWARTPFLFRLKIWGVPFGVDP